MARKKKQTRKYKPRSEFRFNYGPKAGGHPHYIFGETKTKYKSLGLTTTPKAAFRHVPLHKNPDLSSSDKSHLQLEVHSGQKKFYGKPLENWGFAKEDMPVVRHTIKAYKKSTNRKPKGWYIRKKRNKK